MRREQVLEMPVFRRALRIREGTVRPRLLQSWPRRPLRRAPGAMQHSTRQRLRIGDWRVDPSSGEICRDTETARLEARTMRLLMCLAEHAGQTVSIDDLLNEVWTGVNVGPDSVYQAVASLRRL